VKRKKNLFFAGKNCLLLPLQGKEYTQLSSSFYSIFGLREQNAWGSLLAWTDIRQDV
jgi:hypothetical protein